MTTDIIEIRRSKAVNGLALLFLVILVVGFAWFSILRSVGNMIAEVSSPNDPNIIEIAGIAKRLAPRDPLVLWLNANAQKQVFSPESVDRAMLYQEDTVRSSPYDYRWWLELGRAYEQADKPERARAAFEQAIRLAPTYAYSHWQFGNYLLRRNNTDEAFAQFRLATVNNQMYREQVFSLAWDYFDHDPAKMEQLISNGPDVDTTLTLFYAARGAAQDAVRIWSRIPPDERQKYPQIASAVTQGLFEKRYFPQALEFSRQLNIDPDASVETITNAGFEFPIADRAATYFGWKLEKNDGKLEASTDSFVKHSGSKSLRINFRNFTNAELYTAGQTVVVQPGRTYTITFWIKTENLRSAGGPQLEVVNANDDKILATSRPFPQGTSEWQQYTLFVTSPSNCNGLVIRTTRSFCGDGCPLVGTLWYDDFVLEKR